MQHLRKSGPVYGACPVLRHPTEAYHSAPLPRPRGGAPTVDDIPAARAARARVRRSPRRGQIETRIWPHPATGRRRPRRPRNRTARARTRAHAALEAWARDAALQAALARIRAAR